MTFDQTPAVGTAALRAIDRAFYELRTGDIDRDEWRASVTEAQGTPPTAAQEAGADRCLAELREYREVLSAQQREMERDEALDRLLTGSPNSPGAYAGFDGEAADEEHGRTSWVIQDISQPGEEVAATVLARIDGQALFYPGRSHSIYGETESAKSLIAQIASAEELRGGNHVLYIDFESDAGSIASRLRTLGVPDEIIMDPGRFAYVRPETKPETAVDLEAFERLTEFPASLVIIDGVNEALSLFGLDPDRAPDVAVFYRTFVHRFGDAAVVTIDHVVKSQDNQGRFPNGSQHKVSGLTGAAYRVVPDKANPPAVGKVGSTVMYVAKDRPGKVRAKSGPVRASDRTQEAARVELDSTGNVTTVRVLPPERVAEGTGPVEHTPTRIMEQIAAELAVHPGIGVRAIHEAIRGKRENISLALRLLIERGHVHTEDGPRNATLHFNTGEPYRADVEEAATVFPLLRGEGRVDS